MQRSDTIGAIGGALAKLGGFWSPVMKVGRYLAYGAHGKDRKYAHHIVCEAFHGPRPDGMQVRHLDGNPHNNCASNLRWGTPTENAEDQRRHGTTCYGERNPRAKLTGQQVTSMRELREREGLSYRVIGERFGVATMTAFRAVTRQSWAGHDAN